MRNIPSVGTPEVFDYDEGQAIRYTSMDTGNFTFTLTDYVASAQYITRKRMQDMYYMNEVVSSFVPKQNHAIMRVMESSLYAIGPDGQTTANSNTINGAKHRFVAGGTNEVMTVTDFAKARYALKKASVPDRNLVAIVDPSVEIELNKITNITNISNNPRWEGVIQTGMATGTRFLYNIFGFDVYVSNNLKTLAASEAIDGVTAAAGVCNLFFSADSSILPFVGSIRQAPTVDSEFNKDLQREEYVTTARFGFGLYRPENLVVVISDTDQVYA